MPSGVPSAARLSLVAGLAAGLVGLGALGVLGAALPVQASGPTPDRAAGRTCSEPFQGLRSSEVTYLVATPRPDTLHDPAAPASPGYGQLADASRVGGAVAEFLGPELDADPTVVLVPWGFDEACRPIAWTGAWRWATTGAEGFYRGRLRSADRWIDGRPTFDVDYAVWEGFPESPWEHPLGTGRERLTAPQLFELYERLPTPDALAARPYGAVSELVDWRRDAGDLAARYPASTLLAAAFRTAELVRLRTSPLPFSGTYRVTLEGSEGDSLATFLLRTGPAGLETLGGPTPTDGRVPTAPAPAPAFATAAAVGSTLGTLEAAALGNSPSVDGCLRPLGLRAAAEETSPDDAARAWAAELSVAFVADCFADLAVLRDLSRVSGDEAVGARADGDPRPDDTAAAGDAERAAASFTGAFRQEADGRFTFRQPVALPDGRTARLAGTRIDLATVPAPPALPGRLR